LTDALIYWPFSADTVANRHISSAGRQAMLMDTALDLLLELFDAGAIALRHHTAAMGASDLQHLQIAIRIIT